MKLTSTHPPLASISEDGDKDYPPAGTELRVLGVGRLEQGGDRPDFLRDVIVPVVDVDDCKDMYEKAGKDVETDIMFCAGNTDDGGEDSCQGDSSGPILLEKNNQKHILMGFVS